MSEPLSSPDIPSSAERAVEAMHQEWARAAADITHEVAEILDHGNPWDSDENRDLVFNRMAYESRNNPWLASLVVSLEQRKKALTLPKHDHDAIQRGVTQLERQIEEEQQRIDLQK